MRGVIYGTPSRALRSAARLTKQFAIATAHQRKTGLNKPDGAVPQIVCLPGPFGDTLGTEQSLRNHTIAVAFDAAIERAQRECQPLSPLHGQLVECRASRAAVERPPESPRRVGSNLEIFIEHQMGGIGLVRSRRFCQPKPMFDVLNAQQNMPAVKGLTDVGGRYVGGAKHLVRGIRSAPSDRNDRRQYFRCPEDGLILRRPRRVSHKSKGPISF
jgi:hypothetical protein